MPTATNPTTGEKMVYVAGKWIPVPGTAKAETTPPEAENSGPGILGRYVTGPLKRGAGAALGAAGVGLSELGVVEPETAAGMVAKGEEWQQSAPRTPEEEAALSAITEAPTLLEGAKAAARNPGALVQLGVESLPQSAPSLILGALGALGGPVGVAAGVGAGSYASEYASSMADVLREAGANPERPEDVAFALRDQNIMAQARERALRRGVPVAAFDALSGGLAGRLVAKSTGLGSFIGRSAAEMGMQGGLGAAGEAGAQRATGEYQPGAIIAEGAAEVPGGVVETAIGSAGHRGGKATGERVDTGVGTPAPQDENAELLAMPPDQAVATLRERYGINGIRAKRVLKMIQEEAGKSANISDSAAADSPAPSRDVTQGPAPADKPKGNKAQSEAIAEKAKANAVAMLRGKWLPIRESEDEDSPIVGYVNEETGEQRTVEEHRAGAESPLSGLEPVLPAPEEMAEQVTAARKEAEKPAGKSEPPRPQSFYPPPSAERRERLAERQAQAAKFPNIARPVQPVPRNAPTFEELKRGPGVQPQNPVEPTSAAAPVPVETAPVKPSFVSGSEPVAETPPAPSLPVASFKTSQGSTYEVNGESTRRHKTPHQGHDPKDVGWKEPSERTVYVDPEDARALGMHGGLSGRKTVMSRGDALYPLAWNEQANDWGMSPSDKPVPFTTTPEVGKSPVELWQGEDEGRGRTYRNWHPGNPIVEMSDAPRAPGPAEADAAAAGVVAPVEEAGAPPSEEDAQQPGEVADGARAEGAAGPAEGVGEAPAEAGPPSAVEEGAAGGQADAAEAVAGPIKPPVAEPAAPNGIARNKAKKAAAAEPAPTEQVRAPNGIAANAERKRRREEIYGTLDKPKRMAVAQRIAEEHLMTGPGIPTIRDARNIVGEIFGAKIEPGTPQAKAVDELVELAGVLAAREEVKKGHSPKTTFDALKRIQERMPTLGTRTSGSVERQAYSTPLPIAWVAARFADTFGAKSVLEPTAGNGALLIDTAPKAIIQANELDDARAEALEAQGFTVSQKDATEDLAYGPFQAVIANPPFGAVRDTVSGQSRRFPIVWEKNRLFETPDVDQAIAWKALSRMRRPDGRAVLIMGAPNEKLQDRAKGYIAGAKQKFYYALYDKYRVVRHYTLSGDLYAKQGAGWPVDLIVIDGVGKSSRPLPAKEPPRFIGSWDELKGLLDDVAAAKAEPAGAGAATERAPGGGAGEAGTRPGGQRPDDVPGAAGRPGAVDDGSRGQPGAADGSVRQPGPRSDERPAGDAGRDQQPGVRGDTGQSRRDDAGQASAGAGSRTGAGAGNAAGGLGGNAEGGVLDEISGASPDELDALLDSALEQAGVGSAPPVPKDVKVKAPPKRKAVPEGKRLGLEASNKLRAELGLPPQTAEQYEAQFAKPGKPKAEWKPRNRGKTAAPAAETKTTATQDLKDAASEAAAAIDAALTGLFKLSGGGSSTLGSGFIFNEETYQAALPAFRTALQHTIKAGQKLVDFATKVFAQAKAAAMPDEWIRTVLKPMIARFVDEVRRGVISLDETAKPRERKSTPEAVASELQVAYAPRSKDTDSVGTLIPVNMAQGAREAFEQFEAKRGPVDSFVASKLGYSREKLGEYFSAEQVDALALAIETIDSGTGFIIGDQTGVGKGRINAAIIRYAIRNGQTPIFVTEKPNLYADMIRDLSDIGMKDFDPFVTNSGLTGAEAIETPDGRRITTPSDHKSNLFAAMEAGALVDKDGNSYDAIFTTYSQLQEVKKARTPRHAFLEKFLPNGVLILDESHNAGGSGKKDDDRGGKNQGTPRSEIIRKYVGKARAAFYSSATYAKRPDSMSLYYKTDLRIAVPDFSKIDQLFTKGGVALQQVLSSMLTKAGQYLRRERSFDGVEFSPKPFPVKPEFAERASTAMRTIVDFEDKVIKPIITGLKEESAGEGSASGGDASQVTSTNFTALMHNVIDQMLLCLKAEAAAAEALEALERGEKPVIAVANTMGSMIEELVAEAGLKSGDRIDFTFKDVMLRYLERTRWYTKGDAYGKKERVYITDADLGERGLAAFKAAQKLIRQMDFAGLPGSPIDHIIATIEAAGYKVGEITGRSHIIDYSNPKMGAVYRVRPSSEKSKGNVVKSISRFNGGTKDKPLPQDQRLDVMILNQSGATGLSLHASERFGDQRRRRMIIAQAERNIDTFMQMLGRVHRTGQIVPPAYTLAIADIPAEKRPAAVLLKKMASLNANTTASAEGNLDVGDLPDFMNDIGDEVAASLLDDDIDLWDKLGRPLKMDDKSQGFSRENAMRRVTGRIPLLPVKEQEEVYARLESEYQETIERKKALGENVGGAETLDLDARTASRTKVFQADGDSPFSQPAYLEQVDVKRIGKPYTTAEAAGLVAEGKAKAPNVEAIRREADAYISAEVEALRSRADEKGTDAEAATERMAREKARLEGYRDRLAFTLQDLPIGQEIHMLDAEGIGLYGVVAKIERKGKSKNPAALGTWRVTLALADPIRQLVLPLSKVYTQSTRPRGEVPEGSILIDPQYGRVWLGDGSPAMSVMEMFDARQGSSREKRHMLTGNVFAGFNHFKGKGQIVFYSDAEGVVRQGVLMPRSFKGAEELANQPQPVAANAVVPFFDAGGEQLMSQDQALVLSRSYGVWSLIAAKSKARGGRYFTNKPLIAALGREFVSSGGSMVVKGFNDGQAMRAAKAIEEQFGQLYAYKQQKAARKVQGIPEPEVETVGEPEAKLQALGSVTGGRGDGTLALLRDLAADWNADGLRQVRARSESFDAYERLTPADMPALMGMLNDLLERRGATSRVSGIELGSNGRGFLIRYGKKGREFRSSTENPFVAVQENLSWMSGKADRAVAKVGLTDADRPLATIGGANRLTPGHGRWGGEPANAATAAEVDASRYASALKRQELERARMPNLRAVDGESKLQALGSDTAAKPPGVAETVRLAANAVAGNLDSAMTAELRATIEPDLKALLKKLAGDRANLKVFDVILGHAASGGETAKLSEDVWIGGLQVRDLIAIAILDGSAVRPMGEIFGTVRHEVIHLLKETGAIPAPAWAALEAKAPQWRKTFGLDEGHYASLSEAARNEEAIAEAYRLWADGSLKLAGSPLAGMRWIKRFMDGLRGIVAKALGLPKLPRPEEVFQAIERGDYAATAGGSGDSDVAKMQVASIGPGALLRDTNRGEMIDRLQEQNTGLLERVMGPNMRGRVGATMDRARRLFQDRFIYVRRIQEEAEQILGRPVGEDEDAYRAEELYYGKVGEQKFRTDKDFKEPIVEAMHNAGLTLDEVDDFLTARHAAERNAAIADINPSMPDGGSGMTNAEAAAILGRFNPEKRQALNQIGELVDQMMARRLENMVDSGIISAQEADAYRSKYQHYVPLRGKAADPDGEVEGALRPIQGRGFMGDRRREKRAMGRESRAPHVLATAFTLADEAIVRGEKNRVGQALLNLAMAAPDPNTWKVNPVEREAYMAKLADGRQQVRYRYRPKTTGKNIVSVRVDGREFRVELMDPDVLRAFANLGGGDLNVALKGLGWITQNLSKLNTMWSPEFIVNNAFMDFQTGLINLGREEQTALRRQVAGNWLRAYKGAVHYLGTGKADTDWSRWAQEFRQNGGQTAFNPITDAPTQAKSIEAAVKELESRNASRARRALHTLGNTIERWNTGVDNAVRLSTYAALRERGYTPAKAASVAKNLTINFNRKGEMGPALNALFMFYNAGTQGTAVLASAIYRSRKVRAAVAGIIVAGAIQEIMGGMFDPPDDDEDGLGLSVYDRIPDWQKKTNIIIPYGSEPGDYVMIRMPYGYNFFHNLGRLTAAFVRGAPEADGKPVGLGKTIAKLAGAFADAIVPPGLGDTLVPSVAAPFVDIWKNEDFFGKPIMPTKFPGDDKPDSQTYFPSANPYAKATADFLNRVTGGNEFRPGLVDVSPESISHVLSTYAGSAGALVLNTTGNARKAVGEALGTNPENPHLDVSDVPFARKIVGTASPWQIKDITYQRIGEIELLADEAKGTDERAKQVRRENRRMLALTDDARKLRKALSNLRKERRRIIDDDALPTPEQRRKTERIDEREHDLMRAFNQRYLRALAPPQP